MVAQVRYLLAVVLLAVWWGGFTFYALVVVPAGHNVLRSKVRQGFITQQVTNRLNLLGAISLIPLLWQLTAVRRSGLSRAGLRTEWVSLTVLALTLATLGWMHPHLDALLDPVNRSVIDDDRFYEWHRWYLLVASAQWLAGLVLLSLLVTSNGTKPTAAVSRP